VQGLLACVVLVVAAWLGLVAGGGPLSAHAGEAPLRSMHSAGTSRAPAGVRVALARVERGLVEITTSFGYAFRYGQGAGMVVGPDGLVLTNTHVVDGAVGIAVTSVATGRLYGAAVVGYDRRQDVAVLRLDGAQDLPTVPLGDASGLTVGTSLVVLGRAHGVRGPPRVSRGVVTGLGRVVMSDEPCGVHTQRLTAMTISGARVAHGDSGGPVLDADGRVIGMIVGSSCGSARPQEPVTGFAVPIDAAMAVVRQVAAGRASDEIHVGPTACLGVAVAALRAPARGSMRGAPRRGAAVAGVVPGYPAAAAGLVAGDVIVSVAGRRVSSGADVTEVVAPLRPGEVIEVVWRDGAGRVHASLLRLAEGPPA